jgi:hypothetical protein
MNRTNRFVDVPRIAWIWKHMESIVQH